MKFDIRTRISFVIFSLLFNFLIVAICCYGQSTQSIRDSLLNNYCDLLIEKGFLDHNGNEIETNFQDLLKKHNLNQSEEAIELILNQLNYSQNNILDMPQYSFDRPIGYKLKNYGRRKQKGLIDGNAEGNGCPVGGLGAGAYERTISGNFRYWFWDSGNMVDEIVWSNQFHVYMKYGKKKIVQTLSTDHPSDKELLKKWKWDYQTGAGKYYALFPKSGFDYSDNPDFPVKIGVLQYSPVWPNNYKESSWPVAVYKWIVENPTSFPVETSIMLTWENMVGWQTKRKSPNTPITERIWVKRAKGNYNQLVEGENITAIVMKKKRRRFERKSDLWGEMCIALGKPSSDCEVTYTTYFNTKGDGKDIYKQFAKNGTIKENKKLIIVKRGKGIGAGLAIKIKLAPGEKMIIPFVVVWDFPFMEFAKDAFYRKKYTQFFNNNGDNSVKIASLALQNFSDWEEKINAWHKEIIEDRKIPGWLTQALFNELYILVETGIWSADLDLFTYLECLDYPMYGTFDVDSYASWHLLKFWPKLEIDNVNFVANTIKLADPQFRQYYYQVVNPNQVPGDKSDYYWNVIKEPGMIIHDLGTVQSYPWIKLNGFDWQNPNKWKDLNPKLPLRAFRDYLYTGKKNINFLVTLQRHLI